MTATVGPPLLQLLLAVGVVVGLGVRAARATRRIVGYAAVTAILAMIWVGSMIWASDALGDGGGAFGVDPHLERPARLIMATSFGPRATSNSGSWSESSISRTFP